MNKGTEVARGKTKILYENPGQPQQLVVTQTDNISAGDGARRHVIAGKGRLAAQTTARVFRLLNLCGLPTHYLSGGEDDDANEMVVRRCTMIPLEVVTRGVAAGSFIKRNPSLQRGTLLVPRVIELLREQGVGDVVVTLGGTIPAEDIPELKSLGVAEVFTPGAPTQAIVDFIRGAAGRRASST